MSSLVSHRLFLITTLSVASFHAINSQELPIVQLPCSSPSPSDSFCIGSLGNVSSLHGSGKSPFAADLISTLFSLTGCMLAENCETVLIGQLNKHNDTIRWQLLNNVKQNATYLILFYLSHNDVPKLIPGEKSKYRNTGLTNF